MSDCQPTDDVRKIIRAMARAKLEEGFTDSSAIVDEIHSAIAEHTPLWKNEIADIVAGIGQPSRKATKSELQERLVQLKRDLRDQYHPKPAPKSPEELRNQTRQTQLKKQIADVQRQIDSQDFSKPVRESPIYNEATQKMQSDLASAKYEADKLMRKLEYQNKSRSAKVLDTLLAFHRASILSGYTVFEHLSGAVLWRLAATPFEQAIGAVLHRVPGVRKYSEAAPTEGGGFQGAAQWEGLKKAFGKETLQDIHDKLVRGYSDKQARGGARVEGNHRFLEFIGHMHDALKTPAENFGYHRALMTANKQARASMARDGMTPAQIDEAMQSPAMMSRNEALAYGESKNAKLQGDNVAVNAVRSILRQISTHGLGGKAIAAAANYQMPILKIPTNLFAEATSYAAGVTKAFGAALNHRGEKLTPEVADYVLRNLKKGLLGKGLAVLAWVMYEQFGAMYDEQRRKRAGEPEYGDLRTPAGTVSHHLLHSPVWTYMMAVALARRVYEHERAKDAKRQTEDQKGDASAAATGVLHGTTAAVEQLPFIDAPAEFFKSIKTSEGVGDYAGKALSELTTPQIVKQAAKATDPEALPRKPSGFVQQMEVGIPGLRENVPLKPVKGMTLDQKLDYYDKMTPKQRDDSGILESIGKTVRNERGKLTDDQIKRLDAL